MTCLLTVTDTGPAPVSTPTGVVVNDGLGWNGREPGELHAGRDRPCRSGDVLVDLHAEHGRTGSSPIDRPLRRRQHAHAASQGTLSLQVSTASSGSHRGLSAAALKASLLRQLAPSGPGSKIGALLQAGGYTSTFTALAAGRVQIKWYHVPAGAHLARARRKPLLVASGRLTARYAGSYELTIRLTAGGRRLLAHAAHVKLTADGALTTASNTTTTAQRTFTLNRSAHVIQHAVGPTACNRSHPERNTVAPAVAVRVGGRRRGERGFCRLAWFPPAADIEPCMRFSRTRLPDVLHRRHSSVPVATAG